MRGRRARYARGAHTQNSKTRFDFERATGAARAVARARVAAFIDYLPSTLYPSWDVVTAIALVFTASVTPFEVPPRSPRKAAVSMSVPSLRVGVSVCRRVQEI